jgi:hypothetical protein
MRIRNASLTGVVLVAIVFIAPGTGRASTIFVTTNGLTLSLDTSELTGAEGDTLIAPFTITNNTGGTITPQFAGGGAGYLSGDPSDGPINSTEASDTCGTLANGLSCTFTIDYPTASDTGETDGDVGVYGSSFGVAPDTSCQAGGPNCALLSYELTTFDTPEPSSLVLLASGLLGLVGCRMRRAVTPDLTFLSNKARQD